MGVQDRDWYREALRERERAADGGEPARLPRKPAPTWLIVMAWVVALLIVLLRILQRISDVGASFKSLTEPLETSTPVGRMMLQLLGAFAEFERALIRERCVAGRKAAAERGVVMGRPPKLDKAKVAKLLAKGLSQSEIARRLDAHPSSVNRCVRTLNGNPRRDKWHPKPSWACV